MHAKFTYAIRFVADLDASVAFFRDKLGLTPRFASPFWTEFETGEMTLALHPASDDNPSGTVQLGFGTADVAQTYAKAKELGLSFTAPPRDEHGVRLATITDHEGAQISLSSPVS